MAGILADLGRKVALSDFLSFVPRLGLDFSVHKLDINYAKNGAHAEALDRDPANENCSFFFLSPVLRLGIHINFEISRSLGFRL